MNANLLRYSALGAVLCSGYANAIGFGELILHSRLGESLRAEVPILSGDGRSIDTACYTLAPLPGTDLPVITSARVRLVRQGNGHRLLIIGNRPISDPVFMINVRANCGLELQREFVLMPELPLTRNDTPEVAPPRTDERGGNPASARAWRSSEGETLHSIAEALAGGNPNQQQRTLTALRRANPDLTPDTPLLEGTAVRLPSKKRPPSPAPAARPDDFQAAPPAPVARRSETSKPQRPPAAAPQGDRVVLGAPPEELKPGEKAAPPRNSISDMEERMLKLETTLHTLSQEVDKLNNALTLTTEALATQNKLQLAQGLQLQQAAPPPPAPPRDTAPSWLEMLLSALLGGGIAAGLAAWLSRRRSDHQALELPLAVSGYRPEVMVSQPPPPPQPSVQAASQPPVAPPPAESAAAPAPRTAAPSAYRHLPTSASATQTLSDIHASTPKPLAVDAVDIPLDDFGDTYVAPASEVVDLNENDSALELAEIMLSFGRVKGAAETLALHIEETSPENIHPWSMLLDLYRRGDMRDEYETLLPKIRAKFNVAIPAWADAGTLISGLKSLEDYAHIVWRISNTWASQECMDYLYDLVHNSRSGQRSGFPLEVVEEIALLMRILESGYGLKRPA